MEMEVEMKEKDLFKAAEEGDLSTFESLSPYTLSKALSLRNEDIHSLLYVAASSSHSQVVKILACSNATTSVINCANEEGWAPLHFAACIGSLEIVETLLMKASKGRLKIAEILISHDVKINVKDKVGCTPLHRAASTGNSELCELLIEEGAEVDAVD